MSGNFERLHEIETLTEVQRAREIVRVEILDQRVSYIVAIDNRSGNAASLPHGTPHTIPAAHIEYRATVVSSTNNGTMVSADIREPEPI